MRTSSAYKNLLKSIIMLALPCFNIYGSVDSDFSFNCSNSDLNEFTESINKAEDLFQWKLIDDAIPYYKKALQSVTSELKEDISIRLAEAFFRIGDYNSAIKTLERTNAGTNSLTLQKPAQEKRKILLKAIIYRRLNEFNRAFNELNQITKNQLSEDSSLLLQLSITHFYNGNLEESKTLLEKLILNSNQMGTQVLSNIYRAKIAQKQGEFCKAAKIISQVQKNIDRSHPLYTEVAYLKGALAYQLGLYHKAITNLEMVIESSSSHNDPWIQMTATLLSDSYIKLYSTQKSGNLVAEEKIEKGTELLENLYKKEQSERNLLLLARFNLLKFKTLKDNLARIKCLSLLENTHLFSNNDTKTEALLLRAQAAESYLEREKLLRELTSEQNKNTGLFAIGWLLRGRNSHERALQQKAANNIAEAQKQYQNAVEFYSITFDSFKAQEADLAKKALNLYIQASYETDDINYSNQAYTKLSSLVDSNASLVIRNRNEYLYLTSLLAVHIFEAVGNPEYLEKAQAYLCQSLEGGVDSLNLDKSLFLLGKIYYLTKKYTEAITLWHKIAVDYSDSEYIPEAFYWCGRASEHIGTCRARAQEYYQQVLWNYPNSPFSAEAYFRTYTYQDYIQGDRHALKHLHSFKQKFPESPYVLNALYLIGLDAKRDRKTSGGKWLSKKSLTKSIDIFQELETRYCSFITEGKFTAKQIEHYAGLYYRATLERALTNLSIADQSLGAKQEIYLEYAENVLKTLIAKLEGSEQSELFSDIIEESTFHLGRTYLRGNNLNAAEAIFTKMIDSYERAKTTRGYYLCRSWNELAVIEMTRKNFTLALEYLQKAEESSKGRILNTEQRLNQWILISECHRSLKNYDQAMLSLSRVINEDAISGLRIKAMMLRSEIYSLQGRHELAKKQLEAASIKGGEWGKQAKAKLENEYGY